MPEAIVKTEPTQHFVVDFASRVGYQRTIVALGDASVFKNDESRGAAALAKRINRALWADFSKEGLNDTLSKQITGLQTKYRALIKNTPYNDLIANGTLNDLLGDYIDFLLARSADKLVRLKQGILKPGDEMNPTLLNLMIEEEQMNLTNLSGEKGTHASSADYTKQLFRDIEPAVKAETYLPLSKIVVDCDLVASDNKEKAADMVSDVLSVLPARRLLQLSDRFGEGDSLAKRLLQPENATTPVLVNAIAESVRQNTRPLSQLFDLQKETPELDRVIALEKLVSAQLHMAFSQPRTLADMVTLEKRTQELVRDYAQVSLSLSYDYLGVGPSTGDPRTVKIRANLKNEMDRFGVNILPLEEAIAKGKELARISAEDLLHGLQNDADLKPQSRIIMGKNVEFLAKMASVEVASKPLAPTAGIIGTELGKLLKNGEVIFTDKDAQYLQTILSGGHNTKETLAL